MLFKLVELSETVPVEMLWKSLKINIWVSPVAEKHEECKRLERFGEKFHNVRKGTGCLWSFTDCNHGQFVSWLVQAKLEQKNKIINKLKQYLQYGA